MDTCICAWCGGRREHTPERSAGCTGCWCEHRPASTHRTRVRVAAIPSPAKDVADVFVLMGGKRYERMIAEAKTSPAWMIDNLEDHGYELLTLEGKQDATDAMLGTLLSLPLIERNGYIRQLAERLELSEDEMRDALNEAFERNGPPIRRLQDHLQSFADEMQTSANAANGGGANGSTDNDGGSLIDALGLDC